MKLWDVEYGAANLTLKHNDIVQSLSWSPDGALLVTTSRDKKLRVWDVRQEKPAQEVPGHPGAKNSRAVWMGETDRIATTGFSRMSDRQLGLWDPRNPKEPIGGFQILDSISGVCMPFWDDGTSCLYLAGKGYATLNSLVYNILTNLVTATSDTTNTRTTNSNTCPSTSQPTPSVASPSCPSVESTSTTMKSSAASRPSTIPTSSPFRSLYRADLRCSRAISTHRRLAPKQVPLLRNGSVARLLCLLRSPWKACMTETRLQRLLLTTRRPRLQQLNRHPRRLSRRSQLRLQHLYQSRHVDHPLQ